MNDLELINNGFAKRVNVKTPEGADYIIGYYFDEEGNPTTEINAKKVIIKECKYDGTLIRETKLTKNNNVSQ